MVNKCPFYSPYAYLYKILYYSHGPLIAGFIPPEDEYYLIDNDEDWMMENNGDEDYYLISK
jgi:hypothetical protein